MNWESQIRPLKTAKESSKSAELSRNGRLSLHLLVRLDQHLLSICYVSVHF